MRRGRRREVINIFWEKLCRKWKLRFLPSSAEMGFTAQTCLHNWIYHICFFSASVLRSFNYLFRHLKKYSLLKKMQFTSRKLFNSSIYWITRLKVGPSWFCSSVQWHWLVEPDGIAGTTRVIFLRKLQREQLYFRGKINKFDVCHRKQGKVTAWATAVKHSLQVKMTGGREKHTFEQSF